MLFIRMWECGVLSHTRLCLEAGWHRRPSQGQSTQTLVVSWPGCIQHPFEACLSRPRPLEPQIQSRHPSSCRTEHPIDMWRWMLPVQRGM